MEILENTQIFYNIVVVLPTFWWHIADYLPRKSGSGVVAYVHLLIGQQVVAHLLRLIWQQPVAKLSAIKARLADSAIFIRAAWIRFLTAADQSR